MTFLSDLNPQQLDAVEATEGPVLVVAGAGSGKTKVITSRIMHLIHKAVSPYQILAMTFTNKAASEMKHRVAIGMSQNMHDLTITTFHSFCARFLRREIEYLERRRNFVIFDTQDQTSCLKRVIRDMGLEKNFPAAKLRNRFSFLKNNGDLDAEPETDPELAIFRNYRAQMEAQNALDFDDLLLFTCRILDRFSECRERYQQRFRYVMVDEYQDTNAIQSRLIHLLLGQDNNLCVVGDEDQSIYGWRGADIRNILEFEIQFPGARTFKLEQNYRSTQRILDYANEVISRNELRKPKKLWTSVGKGRPVAIRDQMTSAHEAEFIVQTIDSFHRQDKLDYSNFAVLFRSNYLSRSIEEYCRRYQIPYQLIGGQKFYDRKEIKDLLCYMRIVVNPRDWTSFTRAAGVPSRGLGAKSLDILFKLFNKGHDLPEVFDLAIAKKTVKGRALKGLKEFQALYLKLLQTVQQEIPSRWLCFLIEQLKYREYLKKLDEDSAEDREDNIDELLGSMQELENDGVVSLPQFMDFSALVSDQDDYAEDVPKVSLMTIHAAKGLEFNTVFVMALEDGVFPNQRSISENPNALEEERRLFYVAVTRAMKRLYLSYARHRQTYGSSASNAKSRFLAAPGASEIEYKVKQDATFANSGFRRSNKSRAKLGDLSSQIERMKVQLAKQDVEVDFGSISEDSEKQDKMLDKKQAKPSSLREGDVVRHTKFGTGTVTSRRGKGDLLTVTVYFPGVGKKTLVAKMAKLVKIFK